MKTKEQNAALAIIVAVTEAIRELGKVPSGLLYAQLCGKLSLEAYKSVLRTIEGAGLIAISREHVITWTGPTIAPARPRSAFDVPDPLYVEDDERDFDWNDDTTEASS